MIVEICRTYGSHGKEPEDAPIEGAYIEMRLVTTYCTCKTLEEAMQQKWFTNERTTNHRVTDTGTAVDYMSAVWLLDIPSIESLLDRCGHDLVVMQSDVVGIDLKLEIYDGYRE